MTKNANNGGEEGAKICHVWVRAQKGTTAELFVYLYVLFVEVGQRGVGCSQPSNKTEIQQTNS